MRAMLVVFCYFALFAGLVLQLLQTLLGAEALVCVALLDELLGIF